MSESSDSDFSSGAANEEDLKMQKLLAEWDEKDAQAEEYVDSDDNEEDDEEAAAKKMALLKNKNEDDEEEASEEELEVEEEASEEGGEEESEDGSEDGNEAEEESDADDDGEEEEVGPEVEEDEDEPVFEDDDEPVKVESDKEEDDEEDEVEEDQDDNEPVVDKLRKKPKKKKSAKPSKNITDPEEGDNEEDAEMKKLLADWDAENGDEEGNEEQDDDDDDSEVSEREVILEDNVVDHIVLAASDLEEAMAEFEKKTGLQAVIAGTIKGLGIKCARISFADATYLEIIAPDPKGPGPIGELIKQKKINELTPFHWAVRTSRAEELKDEVSKFGYTPDHITMFGSKADGTPRKWEMLYLYGHKLGGVCPFFINWANSDHPCATLPIVGKLKKVSIRAPDDDPVHNLLSHVPVDNITIETGKRKFSFSFKTPNGTVKFSSDKPVGFKFPGFEADVGAIPGDDGEQDAEVVFDDPVMPDLLPVADTDYEALPPPAF